MQIHRKNTGNSRLLYLESEGLPYNWQGLIGEIEAFVDSHPSMEFSNDSALIYFFVPGGEEEILETRCWVGREIISPDTELEHEKFALFDLDGGPCFQGEMEIDLNSTVNFRDIFESEEKIRSQLVGEGNELAPTWRLGINCDGADSQDGRGSVSVQVYTASAE